ncbi:MAG TPA: hypothetical protein VLK85_34885 [Ramlibacter sp.]|nr:hypothetical protein [Ramlibacter sp.]
MPRSELIAVFPDAQTRTRAGAPLHAQLDTSAHVHAKANCGSCGEAWFGDVAYCPYCGRPSAGAPVPTASDPPAKADFDWFARADNEGAAGAGGPQASRELASALRAVHGHGPEVVPFASAAADRSTHALAGYIRSSASKVRSYALSGAPERTGAEQPGMGRKPWAKPLALATVLAVLALAVGGLVVTTSDKPAPQGAVRGPVGDAARSGTFELGAGVAASAPAVPRADLEAPSQPRAPAPPARNRSLCSAPNEVAGLCNPQ